MKVIIDITGHKDPLNLILEVSGEARKDKAVKVDTARSLWIPAVNNHGSLGHWEFLEISDPWDLQNTIYSFLLSLKEKTALNHQSMINKTQGVCGGNAVLKLYDINATVNGKRLEIIDSSLINKTQLIEKPILRKKN